MESKTIKKWIVYPFYISGEIVYLFSFALIWLNFMVGSASPYYELVTGNSIKLLLFLQLIIVAGFVILFIMSFFVENLKRFVCEFFLFISFHIALLVISMIFIIPAL
jgi:hypothetical protein